MRRLLVLTHRYVGLAMAVFLTIVGLTGSILAFHAEIELWLNREIFTVPVRKAPMLDALALRERAEALEIRAHIDSVPLHIVPGDTFSIWLAAKRDPVTGDEYRLSYNQLLLDPYTGEKIATLTKWEVSLSKENILTFILHFA